MKAKNNLPMTIYDAIESMVRQSKLFQVLIYNSDWDASDIKEFS